MHEVIVFMENENEYEIGDIENFQNSKDNTFSHQSLIMKTMTKALENAAKEMRAGWFEFKTDRQGNSFKTYNADTRLEFISSVEAVLMAIECDLDEQAKQEIKIPGYSKSRCSQCKYDCLQSQIKIEKYLRFE